MHDLKHFRATRLQAVLALALLCFACNALDEPGPKGSVVIIPTDVRVAQLTAAPPPPISGGTLAVSADGKVAVAADPDRDRVSLVDLETQLVRHVALSAGDEPGRVVLDASARAFVALRGGGALAVIDIPSAALQQRVPVCAAPRGMAFDAAQELLHIACRDGRLVSVLHPSAATPEIARDVRVGLDLRDVMLRDSDQGQQLWVSSFKQVELMQIGQSGEVVSRVAPTDFSVPNFSVNSVVTDRMNVLQPHIAYRSLTDSAGNVLMLHQGESTDEVDIEQPSDHQETTSSPYGSGSSGACDGIVQPAVTTIGRDGTVKTVAMTTGPLSVDMALSADGNSLAVVQAGATDPDAPTRQTFFDMSGSFGSGVARSVPSGFGSFDTTVSDGTKTRISLFDRTQMSSDCAFGIALEIGGQSTSIAFRPRVAIVGQSNWVVQSREPARLTLLTTRGPGSFDGSVIDLGGASVRDTGHDLFHRDAGAGVACATCHAEGAEDGHVWNFTRLGLRRTQALHVGLEGTAPFHWAGDESDLNHLMSDVFVGRMGGVHQSDMRVSALTRWLFALQPPAAPVATDDTAVERGQTLFQSPEVGCSSCHNGEKLTNNRTVDVGTGEALQVPSLRGIVYRAPFMHNGCALSLRDRFSPACGGKAHGNTSNLQANDIDDLVAYLQTL